MVLTGHSVLEGIALRPFRRITGRDADGNVTETADAYDPPIVTVQDGSAVFSNAELAVGFLLQNADLRVTDSTLRAGIRVADRPLDEYPLHEAYSAVALEDSTIELGAGSAVPIVDDGGPAMFVFARSENVPVSLRGVSYGSSIPLDSFYGRDRLRSTDFTSYPETHDGSPGFVFENGLLSVDDAGSFDLGAFTKVFVNRMTSVYAPITWLE